MQITRIGFGAWAIGGEWEFGWGPQRDADSAATIQHTLDRGINRIDTAAAYGFGRSEYVVGDALRDNDLYRQWASVAPPADTGSLRADLRNLLWPWTQPVARRPYGRVIAGLLVEVLTTPDFALEYRARFVEHRRDLGRLILQRARGERNTSYVVDAVTAQLHHTAALLRKVHDDVDAEDPSTADQLHDIIHRVEKQAWMLSAENRIA
ncbi:aldo/keto reductase [Nocardia sp. NPDC052112]|uniref:aldo/keto reductase n=1 Tax=Nocardia sp. NPDC052112 TaxID=3155646 RepID=UPI003435E667